MVTACCCSIPVPFSFAPGTQCNSVPAERRLVVICFAMSTGRTWRPPYGARDAACLVQMLPLGKRSGRSRIGVSLHPMQRRTELVQRKVRKCNENAFPTPGVRNVVR